VDKKKEVKLFIMAPEGSGNHLIRNILSHCSENVIVYGSSYPAGRAGKTVFVTPSGLDPSVVTILFICRDRRCCVGSAKGEGIIRIG